MSEVVILRINNSWKGLKITRRKVHDLQAEEALSKASETRKFVNQEQ